MEEHGWRNGHEETPNQNYGRDMTEAWEVELFKTCGALKMVQELVVVPQIQCIAVCDRKTCSLNLECSETVEGPQSAIQRWGGQCPCRGTEAFPTIQKEKESLMESSREPCEEPDCMCDENCVVWTSNWAWDPINVSTTFFSPFSFYCNIFSGKMSPLTLFYNIPSHSEIFLNVLLFSFDNVFANNLYILTNTQFCSSGRISFFSILFLDLFLN